MKTIKLRISGRVQGVWYRAWTRENALELGLSGWVRNRQDGTVEALICGEPESVDALVAKCWSGPPAAHVENIVITESDEDIPAGFIQESTL